MPKTRATEHSQMQHHSYMTIALSNAIPPSVSHPPPSNPNRGNSRPYILKNKKARQENALENLELLHTTNARHPCHSSGRFQTCGSLGAEPFARSNVVTELLHPQHGRRARRLGLDRVRDALGAGLHGCHGFERSLSSRANASLRGDERFRKPSHAARHGDP